MLTVFEKPKRFRARNGHEVVIFCKAMGFGGEKYFGVCNLGDEWMDASWLVCGRYNPYSLEESSLDLVEEL